MYGSIPLPQKTIEEYSPFETEERLQEIVQLARALNGLRILHVSTLSLGTSTSDLLSSTIPLLKNLGITCDWQIIAPSDDSGKVFQALDEAIGGREDEWDDNVAEAWLKINEMQAGRFDDSYDCVIVHDPQLVAMISFSLRRTSQRPSKKWIWDCNIGLRETPFDIAEMLKPYAEFYDAVVLPMQNCAPEFFGLNKTFCLLPAIDPLSPRNMELPSESLEQVLMKANLDCRRPIISQIAKIDWWDDTLGAIQGYKLAKSVVPEIQLALVGPISMTHPHQEFEDYFEKVAELAKGDPDIYILSNMEEIGSTEINVFQRASQVVIQRSARSGSGMVVAEALWKGRPVIAGRVGEIPQIVRDGENGYLIDNDEQLADRIVELIKDPTKANAMGQSGHEHIRQNFLTTRYLKDYLEILRDVMD